ncbi:methyltransferase domain-containing protein [Fulvimonas sp. R45]|uniref:class I SAM-dependent methyltransferase n=1 Tax=Fulvimonas sp. R45 TaxID=3045937 RepID=UPI00265EE09C|nr:methyltransferase domain-containing protein [Fulvimonas sp. R45]MDO1527643.1 methyltransferase domain-containing protein [Fulvimonas sp. R45]
MGDIELGQALPSQTQWFTFFLQWLRHPRSMASVAPSGRQLGELMARALPDRARYVVELGAGTGAITEALMRHGISPRHLMAVEMNPVLHGCLARRFPELHLVRGDARDLVGLIAESEVFAGGKVDAVLSSLGLLTMSAELQQDILAAAFDVLHPNGVFVQYTYGWRNPLKKHVRHQLGLRCVFAGMAWRNLPPARMFVYCRGGGDTREM